jgi:hypothetical protein
MIKRPKPGSGWDGLNDRFAFRPEAAVPISAKSN